MSNEYKYEICALCDAEFAPGLSYCPECESELAPHYIIDRIARDGAWGCGDVNCDACYADRLDAPSVPQTPTELANDCDWDNGATITRLYVSQSARDALEREYGDQSYVDYLDTQALELHAKGVPDALTRSLSQALQGNDGI